jgi:hypothetical protein
VDVELDEVEVRCPNGPRRLFAVMRQRGERPSYIHPDNHIEFACYDCRRAMQRRGRDVDRVLHRYDLAGTLITTLVVELAMARADGRRDQECGHPHGYYLPSDEFTWHCVSADHHVVYLYRLKPGMIRRTKFRIGEVRRAAQRGTRGQRCWRAFPESSDEFPELFDTHVLALEYLRNRWDAGPVVIEAVKPPRQAKKKQEAEPPPAESVPWLKLFGGDLFT